MKTGGRLETTLGDLVVALTEETTAFVPDEKEAYRMVAHMLLHFSASAGSPSKVRQFKHSQSIHLENAKRR